MSDLTIAPDRERFAEFAQHGNVVPVFVDFVADGETPASAFQKLDDGGYSFLFESAEQSEQSGRYSFLGFEPHLIVRSENGQVRVDQSGCAGASHGTEDPLGALEDIMSRFRFVSEP